MKEDIKQGELSAEEWINQEAEKRFQMPPEKSYGPDSFKYHNNLCQKRRQAFIAGAKTMETYLKEGTRRLEKENRMLKEKIELLSKLVIDDMETGYHSDACPID